MVAEVYGALRSIGVAERATGKRVTHQEVMVAALQARFGRKAAA
jgi:hypothetical protein